MSEIPEPGNRASFSHGLVVRGLSCRRGSYLALDAVGLEVAPGEMVALFGHNGAGKSTLLEAIIGDVNCSDGLVTWGGVPLPTARSPASCLRLGIAYVPQGQAVFETMTVLENLKLGADRGLGGIETISLQATLRQYPDLARHASHPAGLLSGGMRQMLALAMALRIHPKLLLLDEPASGLDKDETSKVDVRISQLKSMGVAILVVDHRVDTLAPVCDRVVVLPAGRVVGSCNGGPRAALTIRLWLQGSDGVGISSSYPDTQRGER